MTRPQPEKPAALTIDVDQWRRDIATFADTTKQALDAIAAELSNGCSGNIPRRSDLRSTGQAPISSTANNAAMSSRDRSAGDDRLARLKDQLAQRISKSN